MQRCNIVEMRARAFNLRETLRTFQSQSQLKAQRVCRFQSFTDRTMRGIFDGAIILINGINSNKTHPHCSFQPFLSFAHVLDIFFFNYIICTIRLSLEARWPHVNAGEQMDSVIWCKLNNFSRFSHSEIAPFFSPPQTNSFISIWTSAVRRYHTFHQENQKRDDWTLHSMTNSDKIRW